MSGLRYETGRDMPPGMQELAADSLVKRMQGKGLVVKGTPLDGAIIVAGELDAGILIQEFRALQPKSEPVAEDNAKESEAERDREKLIDLLLEANKAAERMCQEHIGCDECHYRAPNGCTWGFIAERLIAAGVIVPPEEE